MNNLKKTEWDLGTRLAVERSPVGLISSMDRALGLIIAKSRSSLNFSGSFSTSIQLLSFRLFSLLPPQRLLCVVGRLGRKKRVRHYRGFTGASSLSKPCGDSREAQFHARGVRARERTWEGAGWNDWHTNKPSPNPLFLLFPGSHVQCPATSKCFSVSCGRVT